jgi:hypothetical protein
MSHRHGLRILLLSALSPVVVAGCGKKGLEGPEAEVKPTNVKVELPAVPDFALPPSPGEGLHSVKELRVKGTKLLNSDISVKGVITWAYDCATAIAQPGQTPKEVADIIEKDPTRCDRQKFYVGDTKDTPIEKSLWIVDVPRPFKAGERKNGPKEYLKNPPPDRCDDKDPKRKLACPVYAVGDTVTITGTFAVASNHSERNSDGLMIYKTMKNETQSWETPPPDPNAVPPAGAAPAAPPAGAKLSPEKAVLQGKKT